MKEIEAFLDGLNIPDFYGRIEVTYQNGKACTMQVTSTMKLRKKKERQGGKKRAL